MNNSRYRIIRKLGYGSFSTVWLAKDLSDANVNKYVALKVLTADASLDQKESDILRTLSNSTLDHPGKRYVMTLLDAFVHEGPNGSHQCLIFEAMGSSLGALLEDYPRGLHGRKNPVLEFYDEEEEAQAVRELENSAIDIGAESPDTADGGFDDDRSVTVVEEKYGRRLPLRMAKIVLRQMLLAIDFMHRSNITHSDLQPGNVLLQLKSLSHVEEERLCQANDVKSLVPVHRIDGKPDSWAPKYLALNRSLTDYLDLNADVEIKVSDLGASFFTDFPPQKPVTPTGLRSPEFMCKRQTGPAQDIWSFGCLIFEFLTGRPLFAIVSYGCTKEEIDDDHFLQLHDILGPLPKYVMEMWPRSGKYFNEKGEQICYDVGESSADTMEDSKSDPGSIQSLLPLEACFDKHRPEGMSEEEAATVKALLRQVLRYNGGERPAASTLLEHSWFTERAEDQINGVK